MRIGVIYHSETGHTRVVAEYIARQTGADLIQVGSRFPYSCISRVVVGVRRALSGTEEQTEPAVIDVSAYDCIVVGSPVWAGHPTPAINGAVARLQGAAGKEVVAFVTCGVASRGAERILAGMLAGRGLRVKGSVAISRIELKNVTRLNRLVGMVQSPYSGTIRVD
jgi:menaquinone-dependent protoporphyrinogen IX oxidase